MSNQQDQRVQQLVKLAGELPPDAREAWLAEQCGDDSRLLELALARLTAPPDSEAETRVASGDGPDGARPSSAGSETSKKPPPRIGRYVLQHQIGEGGMGVVYLARRETDADAPEQRDTGGSSRTTTGMLVALKLMRTTIASEADRQRFERERRLLGGLDHPNIARLLDAGTTDEGHPFFVMECVRGTPIDRYCDDNRLTTSERLDLFRKVCDAVHYVHENLVIHRDLKPANILVTAQGEPKLLDFGIAKLLNPALDPLIEVTGPGFRVMTPRYASPEQVRNLPLTTATDVYSLGVLLYELLTGHWPYAVKTTEMRAVESAICDLEPERPSAAVTRADVVLPAPGTASLDPTELARRRGGPPSKLRSQLRGDLDNVLLKALDKSPRRRYRSAIELAEDIRRHLANETVIARPPSAGYRAAKFVRRNRAGVVAGTLVLVTLAGGVLGTASGWRSASVESARARASEEEARAAAEQAKERGDEIVKLALRMVGDFQAKIVRLPGTGPIRGEMAQVAAESIERLLATSPGDAALRLALARALVEQGQSLADTRSPSSGDVQGALKLQRRALEIRREEFARSPGSAQLAFDVATSHMRIADLERLAGACDQAVAEYEMASALLEPLLDAADQPAGVRAVLAAALANNAECRESSGDLDSAFELARRAQDMRRQELARAPSPRARRNLAVGALDLARLHAARGDVAAALAEAEQGVAIRRELVGESPEAAEPRRDLARALIVLSRLVEPERSVRACDAAREARALAQRLVDDERVDSSRGVDTRTRHALVSARLLVARCPDAANAPSDVALELDGALEDARTLRRDAPDVIEYRRVLVEALLARGAWASEFGDHETARRSLREAEDEATRILGLSSEALWDVTIQARVRKSAGDAEARAATRASATTTERNAALERAAEWYARRAEAYRKLPDGPARRDGLIGVDEAVAALRADH